ncbi:MAG TPA: ligase-associated DNA damage response DEXH box helicase [Saprospiraceae bacterium]|nr:ligase-associated DNA damage response DEXH box helicase [Saprospiraceae bacterium]
MNKKDCAQLWEAFFRSKGWQPLSYQKKAFDRIFNGYNGLVNAPTGSGKTYSLLLPLFLKGLQIQHEKGLFAIWITPLRAIAQEIKESAEELDTFYSLGWDIQIRTGDTDSKTRQKQLRKPPQILITTPESIHLILASKQYKDFFGKIRFFVVDEWHELLGSKRAVQVELALSRLKTLSPRLKIWGISATIGNLEQGMQVLLGHTKHYQKRTLLRSGIQKKIDVHPLIPDSLKEMRWAGNLGISMKHKVHEVISKYKTTLIFTNTRSQTERWYHELLETYPDLAGAIALHHGSLDRSVRYWVEEALHKGLLKAVVCTSSLDLGVDFRPVEAIVQIGSPKGVSRFFQRAGRSNHQPGAPSIIYFLPTHSMEVIEYMALKQSLQKSDFEARLPHILCFDVLSQYLVTLAVSDGFKPDEILEEVKSSFCYSDMTKSEWQEVLEYISTGGKAIKASGDFKKVEWIPEESKYRVRNRRVAMRHRLSIGTIVSDGMMLVKFLKGGTIGMIEERFITGLFEDDAFIFAGRTLKLVKIKDNTVLVRRAKSKDPKVPAYGGGRMSLSSQLGERLRNAIYELQKPRKQMPGLIRELLQTQEKRAALPGPGTLLIEHYHSREGQHLFFYPFEGRRVHEALASLIAYRIGQQMPISFSMAFNDYGLELVTDKKEVPLEKLNFDDLFRVDQLSEDLMASINSAEMAKRSFRDIAGISGMVFSGFPGKKKKERQLVSSTNLLFSVFSEYDPDNIMYRQSLREVFEYQIEEERLRTALERVSLQEKMLVPIERPTPFGLPIMVDRLRARLSTEKIEDRLRRVFSVS